MAPPPTPPIGIGQASSQASSPATPTIPESELAKIADPNRRVLVEWFNKGQPASEKKTKYKEKAKLTGTAGGEEEEEREEEERLSGNLENAVQQLNISKEQQNSILRRLDRDIHWMSFLYHSNMFAHEAILKLYNTPGVVDTAYYIIARTKIRDGVRNFKFRTLANIAVRSEIPFTKPQ